MTCRSLVFISALVAAAGRTAAAQAPAAAPARAATATAGPGRYSLISSESGLFMLDATTGRIWRYIRVTVSDADVRPEQEFRALQRRTELGRELTTAERQDLDRIVREEKEADANPCSGLVSCFVEVDRVDLVADGTWRSSVVRKK